MYVFVVIFLIIFGIVISTTFARWLLDFQTELKYLGCEIQRTEEREKKYWIRKRRKLWLSLLPFVKY